MFLLQIIEAYPMIFSRIDSVAFFGSMIRGDTDRYSDLDILLVSSDWHSLKAAKKLLQKYGFSCSCYSWEKLRFMTERKFLFIQHLKQESYIVKDIDGKLFDLLASYEAASNYDEEITLAKKLVSITEYFPDNPIGIGWALDILSVSFRNLAILSLANSGVYIFSYNNLISSLLNSGYIFDSSQLYLSNLRKFKASYRNREFWTLPQKEFVFSIQRILAGAFEIDIRPKVISKMAFQYHCLYSDYYSEDNNWYLRTRLCEGAFLIWLGLSSIYNRNYSKNVSDIMEKITNPSCYNFCINLTEEDLRSEVIALMYFDKKIAA